MPDLLDELPSARGGRKPRQPLSIEMTRELVPQDIEALLEGEAPSRPQTGAALLNIRHSHHQLARLVAEGVAQEEISAITGYSPSYISILKEDPAFRELLAFYSAQREAIFVDTAERMKTVGLSALDELQNRLEQNPDGWKNRELMEMTELLLLKPQQSQGRSPARGEGGGTPGSVAIAVSFVQAAPLPEGGPKAPMITIEASAEEEGA